MKAKAIVKASMPAIVKAVLAGKVKEHMESIYKAHGLK